VEAVGRECGEAGAAEVRKRRRHEWLVELRQDIRYGARQLRWTPSFPIADESERGVDQAATRFSTAATRSSREIPRQSVDIIPQDGRGRSLFWRWSLCLANIAA
jgi:hypothetical protein